MSHQHQTFPAFSSNILQLLVKNSEACGDLPAWCKDNIELSGTHDSHNFQFVV